MASVVVRLCCKGVDEMDVELLRRALTARGYVDGKYEAGKLIEIMQNILCEHRYVLWVDSTGIDTDEHGLNRLSSNHWPFCGKCGKERE